MFEYLAVAMGFAFAAVIQPGPLQAFLLSRIAVIGWKRTLPASLAPLLSDGPIVLLVMLVLTNIPAGLELGLRFAGSLVLLYFAFKVYRQWRRQDEVDPLQGPGAPKTLFQAALVNLLNPSPYLGWSLVLGPMLLEAWEQSASHAIGFLVAFYLTMVTGLVLFIVLLGSTRWLSPGIRRGLLPISALILVLIAIYQFSSVIKGVLS